MRQMNLSMKQKQNHRDREQTGGCQAGDDNGCCLSCVLTESALQHHGFLLPVSLRSCLKGMEDIPSRWRVEGKGKETVSEHWIESRDWKVQE